MKAAAASALLSTRTSGAAMPPDVPTELRHSQWEVVAPGIWKATLGTPEAQTPVRARRFQPAIEGLRRLPEEKTEPISSPTWRLSTRGVELQLPLEADEMMYGFGLQLLSFQQRSKKRTIRVNADPKVDSGDTHAPVPFYVTTRGYGIFVDTFRQAQFYCGQAHPRPDRPISATELEVNTPQMTRARDQHALGRVLIEVPRCSGVDVYVFAGPHLREAVQRYNLFSGGGVVPPEWGLGFWYRPEMHLSADEVLKLAREFRADQIPCDVLGLEPGWQTHAYSCTFAWDRHRYPDPKRFISAARDEGFRINLWEHAFTHPASPIFESLVPHSGSIAVWDGLVPDFASESGRKIFGDYHGRELIDSGISGFKLDECDNSDFTEGWSFPDSSSFPSGVDGEQMHAQFGLRYQDALLDQFRKRGLETWSLVRSSGALAAPYPFVLYSDLYDHRQFVRALVNSGFSGLLWSPEVRDADSEEDLIRRLQSVVFSPLAMVNAWYIKNPPWKQIRRDENNAGKLSPTAASLQSRCQQIIQWRMQLKPYLHAAFGDYQRDGLPPFRALVMDHSDEPALAKVDDEYYVGDRMIVMPLFAGEAERQAILPKGDWHNFWTGEPVKGGAAFKLPGSHEEIPVFVRSGSLVPWAAVSQHSADPEGRKLTVRVYGDGHMGWSSHIGSESLTLNWNNRTKRGAVQANGSKYQVIKWQEIG